MAIVSMKNAVVGYGRGPVIDGVSFEVDSGQIFCLLGPNGSGKTTLLECILGIRQLENGTLRINGVKHSKMPRHEIARQIAFVPQRHERTFPYLVHEIVAMGRAAYTGMFGAPKKADRAIVDDALKRLGIDHLAERPYTELSGGESQLAMIARALVQEAGVIVMDEPTAHLDINHELMILETITDLVRNDKKALFIATHSPNHCLFFQGSGAAIKVAMLKNGGFLFQGPPDEVMTPAAVRQLYGVNAGFVSYPVSENRSIRQLVPIGTIKEREDG